MLLPHVVKVFFIHIKCVLLPDLESPHPDVFNGKVVLESIYEVNEGQLNFTLDIVFLSEKELLDDHSVYSLDTFYYFMADNREEGNTELTV